MHTNDHPNTSLLRVNLSTESFFVNLVKGHSNGGGNGHKIHRTSNNLNFSGDIAKFVVGIKVYRISFLE
jgi:hypothetical protein